MRFHSRDFLAAFSATLIPTAFAVNSTSDNCQCGFYDATAKKLFTESIILYFNETTDLPIPGFVQETYTHKYEKGWNTQFRMGADPANIEISNSSLSNTDPTGNQTTSLNLHVLPARQNHLVVGSSIRSSRQDIQYGSFTSLMRSPGQWAGGPGGSALSMALYFNLSQTINVNLENTDMNSTARVSMLANEEFPDKKFIVPYGNMTNGTFGNNTISPWEYTEFRIDWIDEGVKFYIGGHLARTIKKHTPGSQFSTPSPLYFTHLSNGNIYGSQGPPKNNTVANVGWTRSFFNSSSMTKEDHVNFGKRCRVSDACSISDTSLRGSTPWSDDAILKWKQIPKPRPKRAFAIWLAVACIGLTTFLLLQPVGKRAVEKLPKLKKAHNTHPEPEIQKPPATMSRLFDSRAPTLAGTANVTPANRTRAPSLRSATTLNETRPNSTSATPYGGTRPSSLYSKVNLHDKTERLSTGQDGRLPSRNDRSLANSSTTIDHTIHNEWTSSEKPPKVDWPLGAKIELSDEITPISSHKTEPKSGYIDEVAAKDFSNTISFKEPENKTIDTAPGLLDATHIEEWKSNVPTHTEPLYPPKPQPPPAGSIEPKKNLPAPKKRVDYLAGLVAVSSLLVTAIHFNLTFVYGTLNAGAYTHYVSETVARKFINSYFLNLLWIGPFLMTSTRFLVSSYLRTGDLLPVAEKTVGRAPRLMIPIVAMVLVEYFLINAGATKWLEYLPSITWSTWPFTAGFTNFSNFLSEVLELMYLIPNAAPLLTFNYCTGVLWTIPVQLQGSWLTLLGVIVIREIKTPWKRFGFYAFCILQHWYGLSWGSYFYIGILLTDLDVTYKWRPWLHARPLIYYTFLFFSIAAGIMGLTMDLITQLTFVNYATYEYAIHPDIQSGLPISQADHAGYPQYFLPRLNGIVFAAGFQAAVEISPIIQTLLSNKFLVLIFPHIFTIYLLHGFVFWSIGSFLCIQLATRGVPYWANLSIVAVVCYSTIALSLPFMTPMVEIMGKTITQSIWRSAREESVKKKPTLWPFGGDFLLDRYVTEHEGKKTKDATVDQLKDPEPV